MGDIHNKGERKEVKTQRTFNAFASIMGGGYGGSMSSMIKRVASQLSEDESTPDPALK